MVGDALEVVGATVNIVALVFWLGVGVGRCVGASKAAQPSRVLVATSV